MWKRFENLAFCLSESINIVQQQRFPCIFLLDISKTSFSLDPTIIKLLCHSHGFSLNLFCNNLQSLFSTDKAIGIALGDFNINILSNSNKYLTNILLPYELIVTETTHIISSVIDHVYVSNHSLQNVRVE